MAKQADPVLDLIDVLHRLRLSDIDEMDDTTLKAISALILNWQELITREIDTRALTKGRPRKSKR
jgi:hypothetical protein